MAAVKTICFTGLNPQQLGGDDLNPSSFWVKQTLSAAIKRAVNRRISSFISGGAPGADLWTAEILLQIKAQQIKKSHHGRSEIRLTIAQPCTSPAQGWPPEQRRQYDKLLQKADKILAVSRGLATAINKRKRDVWMIDHSDAMIAVWDGAVGRVGIAIAYARDARKPVLVIDPQKKTEKWLLN